MTPGELYDELHSRFGLGKHDDVVSTGEYWKERGLEISKLKGMMRRRNVSEEQLLIAAVYATTHHRPIKYLPQIFALIPEAMREHRRVEKVVRQNNLRCEMDEAIAEARSTGAEQWADRLMRTADADIERTLTQWRSR